MFRILEILDFSTLTSGDLNFDFSKSMTEIVSKCFSTSFRTFLFIIRASGAELEGVVQSPPRPGAGGAEHRPGAG